MIVRDLIAELEKCDPEAVVLVPENTELETFEELSFVECDLAMDDDGNIGIGELTDEYADAGFEEDDVVEGFSIVILNIN